MHTQRSEHADVDGFELFRRAIVECDAQQMVCLPIRVHLGLSASHGEKSGQLYQIRMNTYALVGVRKRLCRPNEFFSVVVFRQKSRIKIATEHRAAMRPQALN